MTKKTAQNQIEAPVRPPIVAVLGHVDHGKTSILDYIRKTKIADKEEGGITQHIGSYQIDVPETVKKKYPNAPDKISFIDTPGHEAFGAMRSRGVEACDIAILVVAANDGVKPQTIESINYIHDAKIISLVCINKIDLPNINLESVKKQLNKAGIKLEEYGGDIPLVKVSAKTGEGIDKLIETIIFLADFYQIKSDKISPFQGVVIESTLSKFKGITATIFVKQGNLKLADEVISENQIFKIRALYDWQGKSLSGVNPGDPVEILGWKNIPAVGSLIYKKDESEIINKPHQDIEPIKQKPLMVENQPDQSDIKKIKIIIKADTVGTLEAVVNGLNIDVDIIQKGVGLISESDILLAKTAKAIVIGFNQKPLPQVSKLAQSEKVLIKIYNIIYQLFDEIRDVSEAINKGDLVTILGEAKVLNLYNFKNETILGAKVVSGRIARGDQVKIKRNNEEIGNNRIKSLKHFKDEITKAEAGAEIGIGLAQKTEILTGDSIISIG
ncbi:translation initiation factor IF-2 [Candidatus Gottesmanbacteria bacterium RBG_16_38_7b]|uniref:Translation initiation factor IF-2 n=1 Tax=Candidatus Gottesmanbacteria bacterium RBG_16_38_7b TaxID=1798372 RepID=A0A1F5YGU1_9BACT|nr:MAG: translation initiation factor IF-2 [Candidatus Gottesmanbacteria bacterium RBG_16_38_7b]